MTTINAIINSLNFAPAATRIDIWHEGGGIGHWEIMFDNSSGASQILTTNYEATDLGINGVVLTKGYVDDVSPNDKDASAVLSKYVKVIGRNYGLSLACLFLIKNYATVKFDDLIADALSAAGSEITYTSPHTGTIVDAVFNKTYLQNGFVDAAKLIDYDFTVRNDKSLQLWHLNAAPSSGVLLKSVAGASDNNILLIDPETKAGVDIRNYIRIDAGMLNDHYTEGNASDYGHVNCSVTDDETLFVVGASSMKITFSSTSATKAYLEFPRYNQAYLDFTAKSTTAKIWVDRVTTARFFIYLKDDGGNEIIYGIDEDGGMWKEIDFPLGLGTNIKASTVAAKEWHYLSGSSFSWKITRVGLYFPSSFAGTGATFWFDGLQIDGVEVWAYASDATSQAAYGVRSIPLTRTDIKSQKQLQSIANTELIVRKDPIFKLNLTCTLQTDLLYSGYTVDVLAPNDYIGSGVTPVTYRILTIHHAAEPGADLCKGHDAITEVELVRHDGGIGADPTRFKLATSPQVAINTRYDQRLDVLEKSITGAQAITGTGGNGSVSSASLFEVTSKLTVDLLQVFKDSGNVLVYAGGHTTPTNVAAPTGNYINVFASVISPLDHVTVMTDPILIFDQGILVEKDVEAFGAFMTASDPYKGFGGGAVMFGHGFENVSDPPRLNMTDVGFHELALTAGSSLVGGVWSQTNLDAVLADLRLRVLTSKVATGTAPINVVSTTVCPNLNADLIDGHHSGDFLVNPVPSGGNLKFADSDVLFYRPITGTDANKASLRFQSPVNGAFIVEQTLACNSLLVSIATGTAPIAVNSTTMCENLNADLLDGNDASAFLAVGATASDSDKLDGHHASDFLTSISFNQPAIDANFNSVNAVVALKVGTYGAPDLQISLDASNVYFNNMATKDTYLGTTAGKKVYVQRNLEIGGSLVYNNTTVISNLNAEYLQGNHASAFLAVSGTAADSDKVDGQHASAFLGASAQATDSDKLDGVHATAFLLVGGTAVDSDKVDGYHASAFPLLSAGYINLTGIHFGTGFPDLYANTVLTKKVLEISGTGVIVDGFLNVDSLASTKAIGIAIATGTAPLSISSTTKVANLNADLLDGLEAVAFLGVSAQAADSDKLDGLHSTSFLAVGGTAVDSDKVDGVHASGFLAVGATAADSDKLDGQHASAFVTSFNQSAIDANFNSVNGIAALKLGTYGSPDFQISADVTYVYLNNMASTKDTYLGTTTGKKVYVQRNLEIGGSLVYNNTTLITNLNADLLDGNHATAFLAVGGTASDSDKVDGLHAASFLGASAQAADSDKLDGNHATAFLLVGATAVDSDKVDGLHASSFLGVAATATDSDKVDGYHASTFYKSGDAPSFGNILTAGYLQFGSANQVRAVWVNTSTLELQNSIGTAYTGNLNLANLYVAGGIQPLGAQGYIDIGTPIHFQANPWTSTVATGVAPFIVASTTVVANLNAEYLQGNHASAFLLVGGTAVDSDKVDGLHAASFLGVSATAADSDKVDGHHASDFVTSFNQSAIDANFNSVNGITALKVGVYGSPDFQISVDASNVYLNNMAATKDTYLGTTTGKKIYIQRNLEIGGSLVYNNTTVITNLNAEYLQGNHASAFLGVGATAADSDKVDGQHASAFLGALAQATDSDKLDGNHASAFLLVGGTAFDSDKVDGYHAASFYKSGDAPSFGNILTSGYIQFGAANQVRAVWVNTSTLELQNASGTAYTGNLNLANIYVAGSIQPLGAQGFINIGTPLHFQANQWTSTVTTGTAPFIVASTTVVANLNADLLDGYQSTAFLAVGGTATDSDKVDGLHASSFLGVASQATDSDKLDGSHASAFLLVGGTAVDSDKVDGLHAASFYKSGDAPSFGNILTSGYLQFGAANQVRAVWVNTSTLELQNASGTAYTGNLNLANIYVAGAIQPVGAQGFINIGTSVHFQTYPWTSTVATGTAPFTVASRTLVSNLNVELLNGHPSSDFLTSSLSFNQPAIDANFNSVNALSAFKIGPYGTSLGAITTDANHVYLNAYGPRDIYLGIEDALYGVTVQRKLYVGGNLTGAGTISGTQIKCGGSVGQFEVVGRDAGTSYILYNTSNIFRIYRNSDLVTVDASGNFTVAGVIHPNNDANWEMTVISDKMYLAKAGYTNGITIDASGNSTVAGTLTTLGSIIVKTASYGCLVLTSQYKAAADATNSEICNDIGTYKCLMILGNTSNGGARKVEVWDDLFVSQHIFGYGNLTLSGTLNIGNDLIFNVSGYNVHLQALATNVLAVKDNGGAMAIIEGAYAKVGGIIALETDIYMLNNVRMGSALNIFPSGNNSGNVGGNGAGTNYYWGAVYANYLQYHTSHNAFDALDDLSLVKNYKLKTVKTKGVDLEIIDDASLPFLKNEEGFFEASRSVGFLLGCAKFSALKQDELEQRIADLEEQLKKLKGGA